MKKLNAWDWIALILVLIGGLNWLLIGLFGFDLVGAIFGTMSVTTRIVYILVGAGFVYMLFILGKLEKREQVKATPVASPEA